jgi:hypothetical protein
MAVGAGKSRVQPVTSLDPGYGLINQLSNPALIALKRSNGISPGPAGQAAEEKQPMSNSDWLIIELLAWFGMGAYCYWMAGRKNRRQWLWALLGVAGGLFAVFVISVISEVEEPVEEMEAIESSKSFG